MRPDEIRQATGIDILPRHAPRMVYRCVRCGETFDLERLLYTCPKCRSLLRVADLHFDALRERTGAEWRRVFDLRRACREPGLQGIFLFHELILPSVPLADVVYLGEGHTPMVAASPELEALAREPLPREERRPEPVGLLQGPGHGERHQLPQPLPAHPPARRGARDLRVHRRHLGRRRAVPLVPAQGGGQVRGAPAQGPGHAPAALPAPGERRHRGGDPRGLRRLHEASWRSSPRTTTCSSSTPRTRCGSAGRSPSPSRWPSSWSGRWKTSPSSCPSATPATSPP